MSSYPITCQGGFEVPAVQGKFEVTGFCVTVSNHAADSYFAIVDDPGIRENWSTGRILTTLVDQKNVLAHIKGLADIDTVLSYEFAEPVKTRYGISIYCSNVEPGSVCVYRK